MKRLLVGAMVMALLVVALPAYAGRAEDLQKRYADLVQQRIKINEELLRIEGAFSEIQRMNAEIKASSEIKEEKFEQQIIKTENVE